MKTIPILLLVPTIQTVKGRVVFLRREREKISTLKPLTVWICAVAILPSKPREQGFTTLPLASVRFVLMLKLSLASITRKTLNKTLDDRELRTCLDVTPEERAEEVTLYADTKQSIFASSLLVSQKPAKPPPPKRKAPCQTLQIGLARCFSGTPGENRTHN